MGKLKKKLKQKLSNPVKDFDKFYLEPWVIKGVVSDKQWIDQKEFNITFEDNTGTIIIKAYGDKGELLDTLSVKGKEYYISNINDKAHQSYKSMFTVHNVYIKNLAYLVVFNDVN